MKQNNLVAVILAGGIGVRFWPMTTYKPMVRFFDKTMLEHTLESVRLSGIETVVVVTNPQDASFVSSLSFVRSTSGKSFCRSSSQLDDQW